MIKLSKTFIGLVLVAQVVSANIFHSPVKKIEKHLKAELGTNLFWKDNLVATLKWKQELANDPNADKAVLNILSNIEEANKSLENPKCDKEMYASLYRAINSVGWRCLDPENPPNLIRIHNAVSYLAIDIAKKCHEIHKSELQKRLDGNDSADLAKVVGLGEKGYITNLLYKRGETCMRDAKEKDLTELLDNILSRMRVRDNPDFKYLRTVSDEKGSKIVREDKVAELVKSYITEPCRNIKSKVSDLVPLGQEAVSILTISDKWYDKKNSPFKKLVPALCVCHVFGMVDDETVVRKAIELVPKSGDIAIPYWEGYTDYKRRHEGFSNFIRDFVEWDQAPSKTKSKKTGLFGGSW